MIIGIGNTTWRIQMSEKLTEEELKKINDLNIAQKNARIEAEKYALIAQNIELERDNFVLKIQLKYKIDVEADVIKSTGEIVRKPQKEVAETKEEVQEVVEENTTRVRKSKGKTNG